MKIFDNKVVNFERISTFELTNNEGNVDKIKLHDFIDNQDNANLILTSYYGNKIGMGVFNEKLEMFSVMETMGLSYNEVKYGVSAVELLDLVFYLRYKKAIERLAYEYNKPSVK